MKSSFLSKIEITPLCPSRYTRFLDFADYVVNALGCGSKARAYVHCGMHATYLIVRLQVEKAYIIPVVEA